MSERAICDCGNPLMKSLDGGPAFPIKGYCSDASGALCGEVLCFRGMSLRDYFAGQALIGFCGRELGSSAEAYSSRAYCVADAMLHERIATVKRKEKA